MPDPPARTPRLAPEARRAQLLDAALGVAAADGMAGLSMESVARAAGVTRPVVYDQFGDLDGLVLALLDREEAVALAPLRWIGAAAGDAADPDAFLEAVADAPRTWRLVLMPADGGSPLVRERIERSRRDVTRAIEALLGWGLTARGGPAGLDEALLARLLVAIGEELARLVITHPRRYSPGRLTDATAALIALLPRATSPSHPGRLAPCQPPGGGMAPNDPLPVAAAGKRVPMAQRREQLLDEALGLIGEEGFDALTVDALARRAGVNRVIVYRAYANLAVLRLALLRREGLAIDAQLDALLPAADDPRRADRLLVDSLAAFLDGVLARPRTWRLALLKPEGAPVALQKLVGRRRSQLASKLAPLVASGLRDLDEDAAGVDVDVLARLLLTVGEELGRAVLDVPADRVRIVTSVTNLLRHLSWRAM